MTKGTVDYHLGTYSKPPGCGSCQRALAGWTLIKQNLALDVPENICHSGILQATLQTLQFLHYVKNFICITAFALYFLFACKLEADRATLSYPGRRTWALLETWPSLSRKENTSSKPVFNHGLNKPSKSNTWHQHQWGSLLCQQPQIPPKLRVLRASPEQSWEWDRTTFLFVWRKFFCTG